MSYRKPAVAGRLLAWICAVAVMPAFAFGLDDVALRAKALAEQPYKKPENTLPRELAELGYDQVRDIRFKPDKALWRNRKLPFEVQFFHPGGVYNLPVKINVIGSGGVNPLSFDAADFDYGNNKQLDPTKLKDVGFAGFRVHANVNKDDYKDEVLVFQGASYFRASAKASATACRRAVWRSIRRSCRARSFRISRSSGCPGRARRTTIWSSTPCSIRAA